MDVSGIFDHHAVGADALNQVVFYDGVCGLCNVFVDYLIKKDKKATLKFAPLQGQTAGRYLPDLDPNELKTVVFYSDKKLYTGSDAVIEIFCRLGGMWKAVVVLKIFPRKFRDLVYSFVARNRYKWFGQKESCRIPTENERGRLLP